MKALAAALVAAQKAMPSVQKDSENQGFKRHGKPAKYVSLDKLIETTKPILAEHGLAILQPPTEINGFPALKTILLHESGESLEDTMLLPTPDKQGAHGLGTALTYCRRYAWASMLGIANDEDDDGNTASRGEPKSDALDKPSGSAPVQSSTVAPEPSPPSGLTAEALRLAVEAGYDRTQFAQLVADHAAEKPDEHREWLEAQIARITEEMSNKKAPFEAPTTKRGEKVAS